MEKLFLLKLMLTVTILIFANGIVGIFTVEYNKIQTVLKTTVNLLFATVFILLILLIWTI